MADLDVSVAAEAAVPTATAIIEAAPIETVPVEPVEDAPVLLAVDGPVDVDALRHDAAVMGEINAATSGVIRDMNIQAAPIWDMQNFGRLIEGMVIWDDEATELPTQPVEHPVPAATPEAAHDPHEALHD